MRRELKMLIDGVVIDRELRIVASLGMGADLAKTWVRALGPELLSELASESKRLLKTGEDIPVSSLPEKIFVVVNMIHHDTGIVDFPALVEAWHHTLVDCASQKLGGFYDNSTGRSGK